MASSKWKKALSCLYIPATSDESQPSVQSPKQQPLSPQSTATIDSMPPPSSPLLRLSKQYSKSKKTCAICLTSMKPGQGQAIFTAECSHSFHFQCITSNVKHGNQICPVCRAKWKEIPFHSPVSSILRTRQNTSIPPQSDPWRPLPRADTNRHISSVFHASEPSFFNDDELIEPQPDATDDTYVDTNNPSSGAIAVKTYPEVHAVPKSASREDFTILVNLKALSRRINTYSRAPVDLVTVLDVSGSMAGTKLALLKRAMGFVIQHLGPSDRLSVVAFSSNARRLFPLRRMTDAGRHDALMAVNNLTSNGGTNIAEGLKKGVKLLTDRKWKNPVVSIILLSDGQDTYTIGSPGSARSHTDYRALLPMAAQSDGGDRLRLPVHVFGFGADHDAVAMHSISEGSGGTFSFIETESVIQDAFAQCIGGILSVVVQELEVVVECVDQKLQIGSIKSGSYITRTTQDLRRGFISVGDLYADEERDFLVTVRLPVGSVGNEMELLTVRCVYKDPITKESVIFDEPNVVKIERPEVTGELTVSLEVDRQRNRLGAAEAMAEAKSAAEKGDLNGAVAILDNFRKLLSDSISAKARDPLCLGLAADVREMMTRMGNKRAYEASGRAYVLSGMSSHSWQRANARGDSTHSTSVLQAYQTPTMTDMVTRSQTLYLNSPSPPANFRRGGSFTSSIHPR